MAVILFYFFLRCYVLKCVCVYGVGKVVDIYIYVWFRVFVLGWILVGFINFVVGFGILLVVG